MLSFSDISISDVSVMILNAGYDVSFLVLTPTGLEKSILDAHDSLRAFFKRTDVHDYSLQKQGIIQYLDADFITSHEVFKVKVSLYRPKTKKGDPRIWIYGLAKFVKAYNLLALVVVDQKLYIFNCSNKDDLSAALDNALPKIKKALNPVASELLQKLIIISQKGFIPTVVRGDTGVGMTLEHELGISANSSRNPDYKGIEIKASRVNEGDRQKNRNQLFSKIPSWSLSPVSSVAELINKRGYIDKDGHQALRQTLSGGRVNAQGLYLDIDYANDYLRQMFKNAEDFSEHDTTWVLQELKSILLKKHRETFWVKARHNNNRSAESFHYIAVEHTANPYIDKLETLIETGLITLDYTMHIKPNGRIRDHGYLFKLHQNSKSSLFPESTKYDLIGNYTQAT